MDNEEKSFTRLRSKFEKYVENSDKKISNLENDLEYAKIKLGFYKFYYDFSSGNLSDKVKEIFTMNNTDNGRIKTILELTEQVLSFDEIPLEIKLTIEEMFTNE